MRIAIFMVFASVMALVSSPVAAQTMDGQQLPEEMQEMPPPLSQTEVESGTLTDLTISDQDEQPQPLRVGMVAERGAVYLQAQIEPFRRYLQVRLSRPVEVVAFANMRLLMAAHSSRQVDYAHYPASIFAMAQAACGCLLPLVAPVDSKAPDGTYMVLIVRSEDKITSLGDMSGRSLALSSRKAALPFHMGLNELRKAGLNPEIDLASVEVQASPEAALKLLETGKVDAALVWSSTPYNQTLLSAPGAVSAYLAARSKKKSKAIDPDFLVIWQSPAIPQGPHAVHKDMSRQSRADLVTALKAMNKDAPAAYDAVERYYSGGFMAVTLEDYQPLIDIATAK